MTQDGYTLDIDSIAALRRDHNELAALVKKLLSQLPGQKGVDQAQVFACRVKHAHNLPARDNTTEATSSDTLELVRHNGNDHKYTAAWSEIAGTSMSSMIVPADARGLAIKEPWGDWLFMPWIHIEHVKLTSDLNYHASATGTIWRRISGALTDTTQAVTVYCELLASGKKLASGSMTVCVVFPDGYAYVIASDSCES